MLVTPIAHVGHLQAECLDVLWFAGRPCTVQDVVDEINRRHREDEAPVLAYTTILTVMRNLARRGLLERGHSVDHVRAHTYAPTITREAYQQQVARWCLDTYFGGSVDRFVMAADTAATA